MDGTTAIRVGLRHRRTSLLDKTRLKDSASRRKTFAAALKQFEEQMNAAKVVSAATPPINLYYGLVQAGLAMTAAHAPGTWTFSKHGLKVVDMEPGIPDVDVRPDGDGAFQAVSDATGSERTADAINIGALWDSIPGARHVDGDRGPDPFLHANRTPADQRIPVLTTERARTVPAHTSQSLELPCLACARSHT